jgi:hypothetical protein
MSENERPIITKIHYTRTLDSLLESATALIQGCPEKTREYLLEAIEHAIYLDAQKKA